MPRKARIDAPGALHHIIVRGIERRRIFNDDTDRINFLDRLGKVLSETDTKCFAWALIPNFWGTFVHDVLKIAMHVQHERPPVPLDEVGNSDLKSSENPLHRFLSLTGVIVNLEYVSETLFHKIENLKSKYFNSHPDDPIIFHRKELVNAKYPFRALKDEKIKSRFDKELLDCLRHWEYTVITVCLDKKAHKAPIKYGDMIPTITVSLYCLNGTLFSLSKRI